VHQWKKPRICPGFSEQRTDGNAIEMIFHHTRSWSREPFIEIPKTIRGPARLEGFKIPESKSFRA
jgi:hypothetical protein